MSDEDEINEDYELSLALSGLEVDFSIKFDTRQEAEDFYDLVDGEFWEEISKKLIEWKHRGMATVVADGNQ